MSKICWMHTKKRNEKRKMQNKTERELNVLLCPQVVKKERNKNIYI